MGVVHQVEPAALIMGVLYGDAELAEQALDIISRNYGPLEMRSDPFEFSMTGYYAAEMGGSLRKFFCCLRDPVMPDALPSIKLSTNEIEQMFADTTGGTPKRRINIDPGYVTHAKLVLASTKDFSHRIYIGSGIYAETTLRCAGGELVPLDTTYPDYRTPPALDFFNQVRLYVKRNRKQWIRHAASKS